MKHDVQDDYQGRYRLCLDSEKEAVGFFVKVFYKGLVKKQTTNFIEEMVDHYVEKYTTCTYTFHSEAWAHAYGWVDCSFSNQTDPSKEEDFCKESYNKARESQHRLSAKQVPEEELEKAYKEGWKAYKERETKS